MGVSNAKISTGSSEYVRNEISALEGNGKLMAFPGVVRARIERRVGRHHSRRGEIEIVLAAWTMAFEVLDDLRSGVNCVPVNAIIARNDQTGVHPGVGQNLPKPFSLSRIIGVRKHGRTDIHHDALLFPEGVEIFEKLHRLRSRHRFRVLRKGLRGYAKSLHFIASLLELRFGGFQHSYRIFHLLTVLRTVNRNEGSNRSHFDRTEFCSGLYLGRAGSDQQTNHEESQTKNSGILRTKSHKLTSHSYSGFRPLRPVHLFQQLVGSAQVWNHDAPADHQSHIDSFLLLLPGCT